MMKKKFLPFLSITPKPLHLLGSKFLAVLVCAGVIAIGMSTKSGNLSTPWLSYAQASSSIFGVEANPLSPEGGSDWITQTQTDWVRGPVVFWKDIEPSPGVYNWANLSEVITELQLAKANGYEPIVVVTGTPSWAQKYSGYTCGPINSTNFDEFGDFMVALINHFNQPSINIDIKYWELWNEPDASWEDVPSPTFIWFGCWGEKGDTNYYGGGYYGDMLKVVTPKIKTADPQAQVLVGGLLLDCDPNNPPDDPQQPGTKKNCTSSKFLEGILANGGPSSFDGVSYHAYDYYGGPGVYGNPNWHAASNQSGPSLINKGEYIRNVLKKYNAANKYLLNTENALLCDSCSSDTDFERTKAYYLTESFASAVAQGLRANIWFSLQGEWGRNNGLLEYTPPGYTPLPVFYAYQFATQELDGASYVGKVTSFAGVSGYEFSKGNVHIWLMWSGDGSNIPINLPASPLAIYDVDGDPVSSANQQLTITREPYYVELPPFQPRLSLPLLDNDYFVLANGNFENGQAGWAFTNGGLPASIVSTNPVNPTTGGLDPNIPSGSSSARLGSANYPCSSTGVPLGYGEIRQTTTIPNLVNTQIFLDFNYIIYTQDASTSGNLDRFEVYIQDASQSVLRFSDGHTSSNVVGCDKWRRVPGPEDPRNGKQDGWALGTIELSAYEGQTITIIFRNYSRFDGWYNTYTYLDNIRLREVAVP